MRKLLWIVSAAAFAISAPVAAEAQGKGKGAGKPGHAAVAKGKGHKGRDWQKSMRARSDRNRSGLADRRERFIDRDRDGVDDRRNGRYAGSSCPPGLAKKTPACIPPGQAKRIFSEGQRVPTSFNDYIDYGDLPTRYRDFIPDHYETDLYRYIQRDDSLYVVDRRTRIVSEILDLLR